MSPLDQQIITRKITYIEKDLEYLKKYSESSMDYDTYINNFEHQYLSERLLEKIIGRMIDINYHILKNENQFIPKNYHESFEKMAENEWISSNLANELKQAAGLRNALAHEYDNLDSTQVYAGINKILEFTPLYLEEIQNIKKT